jgi:hypothetical protein
MISPSISEQLTVYMLDAFKKNGIEDTLERRLFFLEIVKERWIDEPVIANNPSNFLLHVVLNTMILDLKVDIALQNRS